MQKIQYGKLIHGNVNSEFEKKNSDSMKTFLIFNVSNFSLRTSSAVPIAKLPYKGLGGLAFGGPYRDVLFVVTVANFVDVLEAKVIGNTGVGTALYQITGLGVNGRKTSRLTL